MVTDDINEEYGTNLVIKKVDLSLLGTVALKGIEIRDHHQDTLIFIDQLRTSLLNAKKALDNKVDLGSVSMKGIHMHLTTYKDEEIDNLTIFTDKFEEDNPRDTTSTSSDPFILRTSNIYLDDLNYRQIDENNEVPLEFAAYNGGGSLQDFEIKGPDVSIQINGLYFTDDRGIDFTSVTTGFTYTKQYMDFKNTVVKTPHSFLKAQIHFDYRREDLGNFNELVEIDAVFDKSYLSVLDLNKIYNEIRGDDILRFTTKLHGSLNNFSMTDMRMDSDQGIRIYGNMNFINAVNDELGFLFTGDLENVTAGYHRLKAILPNLLGETLPTEFQRLGKFTLSGITKLTTENIEATIDIDSQVGEILADMEITNFGNIDEARYNGEIEFIGFDVGTFFEDPLFGKMSFLGDVNGKGFRIDNINTTLIGKISKLDFNGYDYQDIGINGTYANNLFDGKLDVEDPNLQMKFEGLADVSEEENQFDFNANIAFADLKAINMYDRDSVAQLQGIIDLDVRGNTIDDIIGIANFRNIKYTNQKDTYPFKQFLVLSTKNDSIKQIRIDSEDIVKGELTGNFKFNQLLPIAQNALGNVYSNYSPYKVEPHQFLNFDFTIYNQIVDIFLPEVSIAPNTKIKGRINADNNHLKLTASSPSIMAYGTRVDSLQVITDNNNPKLPYDSFIKASQINTPYYNLSKLNMVNLRQSDTLFFKSTFEGGNTNKEDFNMDFYFTINEEKKSVIGVEKSTFSFRGSDWSVNPNSDKENKIEFDFRSEEYAFSEFLLKSKEQQIKFRGMLRDSTYKDMHAEFTKVRLSSFLPEVDSLKLRGELNGLVDFTQKDSLYSPKGTLVVRDFKINDFEQGDLSMNMEGDNSYEKYGVAMYLDTKEARSISATGDIDFSKSRPIIDLEVFMTEFQMDAFSPLGEDVLNSLRGTASGNFTLKGFLRNPDMNGSLVLKDAGLKFPYLNVDYDFDGDATIGLDGQSFRFDQIAMKDTKHSTIGILDGEITHQNFSRWFLDLEINSDNLLVLDTQDSEEALYYGTGFIQGNARISGLTDRITIEVNAKTMPNTLFVIPLKDIAAVDTYRLVQFKNEKKPEDVLQDLEVGEIEVFMTEFQMDAFSPLGEDVLNSLRGTASGNFTLKGFLRNPDMNGSLVLKDAGLKFPYLNVDYDFDGDATIGLDGQSFRFDQIAMKDTKHSTIGILDGEITHQNFSRWFLDLEINSDNLLVLDTQDSEEALYYGTGFIQGNARISGLTDRITIEVNAKTMPNTLFVIPLKDIAAVDTYRLVQFKNEKKPEDVLQDLEVGEIEGVDLNIDLEVTKDAVAQVVIDEVNGSELKGSGTGNLQIDINTRGKFNMYGDFTIDNGIYNFRTIGIINKPFKILKGGTISWDGNPYEANLNITAVYTTKANPAILLENFNTSREIDVDLITNIRGSLFNSTQELEIEIPNSNSVIANELDFVLNNGNLNFKATQFLSLLAFNQFASPDRVDIDGGNLITGTTGSALGAILSNMISSDKIQFNLDYTSGNQQNPQNNILTDPTVAVSLTTKVSDRVIINGKVGVPVGAQTQSSVVGEVKVEVLLNESGNFRGVIFNRQNEIQYSAQEEGYTQGIGLSYQVNFNSLSDLLTKMGLKKKDPKEKLVKKKDSVINSPRRLVQFKKN